MKSTGWPIEVSKFGVPFFEEMGSKRMPERVAGDSLGESCKGGGLLHGPLENRFVEVVTIQAPGTGILELPCCGEYPLPTPLLLGSWKFPIQSVRKSNVTFAPRQILFVSGRVTQNAFRKSAGIAGSNSKSC
jgi:hypothetical protein